MIDLASSIKVDEKILLLRGQPKTGYLVPALAIPVEKKSHYECPKNQLATLEHNLPHVKMMITLGWRGMERDFMDMLANLISPSVKVMVVSSSAESAKKRIKYMSDSGFKCELSSAQSSGFTQFARDREATKFLNQMSAPA